MSRINLLVFAVFVGCFAHASESSMEMNFKEKEVIEIIEAYRKSSGEKFIIDPDVRGKITILSEGKVPLPEAFHILSSALAVRGYAILKKDGFLLVRNARSASKDLVETSEYLPESPKPERLFTWVVKVQHLNAEQFEKNLRNLISRDGNFFIDSGRNQMVVTDYLSTLYRIRDLLKFWDKPATK